MTAELKTRWEQALARFTERNAGRRTRLEVDDPDLGAQVQERDMVLRGVAYDGRDGRLEIMLGEQGDPSHLTHTITAPSEVEFATHPDGRDSALRIAHGAGQTVLLLP